MVRLDEAAYIGAPFVDLFLHKHVTHRCSQRQHLEAVRREMARFFSDRREREGEVEGAFFYRYLGSSGEMSTRTDQRISARSVDCLSPSSGQS